jgi:ATP-dependent Clp protease ATP-binding subunit ClpA
MALRKYGRDLTAAAGDADPVIGRDAEIDRVVCILCRRTKNNAVLVGAPGVGKTAIAEGLAQRIAAGTVPPELLEARVVELDLCAIVAGIQYIGTFQTRMKDVITEAEDADGKVILFIDEMHMLVGAGNCKGSMDAANLLKPALARGRVSCVGATTFDEYRMHIEKDPALERRFQKVLVQEPSVEATIAILRGLRQRYEEHHGLKIRDAAIVAATELAGRYITGEEFYPLHSHLLVRVGFLGICHTIILYFKLITWRFCSIIKARIITLRVRKLMSLIVLNYL